MAEYYKTRESVTEYIQMAKEVNGGELIEKLKLHLKAKAALLEIGSGPGTDWRLLSQDFNVVGSDNSSEFLKHLRESNPQGRFLELDAITLQTEEKFDGIYSNKVFHHLKDEELRVSILRQHEILNPDGVICLSFWKGDGSEVFKGLYVNYHNEASLNEYFGSHFDLLELWTYKEFEAGDSLLMIAKKK